MSKFITKCALRDISTGAVLAVAGIAVSFYGMSDVGKLAMFMGGLIVIIGISKSIVSLKISRE